MDEEDLGEHHLPGSAAVGDTSANNQANNSSVNGAKAQVAPNA